MLKNLSALSVSHRNRHSSGDDAGGDDGGSHAAGPSLTQLLSRWADRPEMIWANVDSGAAASVCPREYARGRTVEPGDPNVFIAANDEAVPEEGKVPWSSNMPYLVHVLFKQYYLSNVDAQNQSLFKQCNLSNVKNSKSGNISKSGNEVLKNFEFNKIIFDTKNYQSW